VKIALVVAFPLVAACQKAGTEQSSPAASAAAATSLSAPLVSAPAPAPKAWFEGAWQGGFQAELLRIELALGGVKEWKQDDGTKASGAGTLALDVSADGIATGHATGALGELSIVGRVEGDRAGLRLASPEADGFHGVILAAQTTEGMKGTLNASSGDSLQVRQAAVTLTRSK
jgi:hypothetical protein